jgi:putative oxidoreductase
MRDIANAVSRFFYHRAAGMFVLRFVTGLIFVLHGAMKLSAITIIGAFFGQLGVPAALSVAWAIALLEVIGGAALILGVATRIFGALFAIEMIVAIFLTGVGRGFAAHEFELLLAAAALAIALAGSGRWSLFKSECENCGGIVCDGRECLVVEG